MVRELDPTPTEEELTDITENGYDLDKIEIVVVVSRTKYCTKCRIDLDSWARGCGGMMKGCPHGIEIGL